MKLKLLSLPGPDHADTVFARDANGVTLHQLCGVPLDPSGPARARGLALLQFTHAGGDARIEGDAWRLLSLRRAGPSSVTLTLAAADTGLALESSWTADRATGVVTRRDVLVNRSRHPVTIRRCLARVTMRPGRHEVYAQDSRWCHENQGAWRPLHAGAIVLGCAWGRTTQGGTPYAGVRRADAPAAGGLAFHVVPQGNWTIRISAEAAMDGLPLAVIELGLADANLHLTLRPGQRLALPELLFQALPDGEPHLAAPRLHRHLLAGRFAHAKPAAPVVYNTWFDQFDRLDVPRLRRQLAAARTIGCEAFVIDAGWYGAGAPNWWAQAGDWREKTGAAFDGRMRDFADEVRAAGLGFGIWMEPERVGPDVPVRRAHPDWFIPCGPSARFDLARPAAARWLRREIGRLVETYGLAWMKIDFNFEMEADASGAELHGYHGAWYRLMDEVRAAYPRTFFEGCASGAMRLDLASLSHFDNHFPSDTVHPVDLLRIVQGAALRLPPGRLGRWLVLRAAPGVLPRYGLTVEDSPAAIVVPGGATWEPAETLELDFGALAAVPGMLGFSGDLASLPPDVRRRLAAHVAFHKRWRRFLAASVVHLLTPPEPMTVRTGWIAAQHQRPSDGTSLLFVYRLGSAGAAPRWRLRGLRPDRRYRVERALAPDPAPQVASGARLMEAGLDAAPAADRGWRMHSAGVWVVRPQ